MKMMKRGEIVDMMEDSGDPSMMRVRVRHGKRQKQKPNGPGMPDESTEMHVPKGGDLRIGQRVVMTMMMEPDGDDEGMQETRGVRGKIGKPKR